MTETTFRFLMGECPVSVTFAPALSAEQCQEMHEFVLRPPKNFDLRKLITSAAKVWGVEVQFDVLELV